MKWTEPKKPDNKKTKLYFYIHSKTPIGNFTIKWHIWSSVHYQCFYNDEYIGDALDLDLAKRLVEEYLTIKCRELSVLLGIASNVEDELSFVSDLVRNNDFDLGFRTGYCRAFIITR